MKKVRYILHASFLLAALLPSTAMAQGTDPPPTCCRKNPIVNDVGIAPRQIRPPASSGTGTEVYLSDETIFRLGLTRREMVDRLAATFFPGKSVDLLIPRSSLEESMTAYPPREGRGLLQNPVLDGILVAVEVRRFYLIRMSQVRDEDLISTNQLSITDGETYVTVNLSPGSPVAVIQ